MDDEKIAVKTEAGKTLEVVVVSKNADGHLGGNRRGAQQHQVQAGADQQRSGLRW